MTPKIRVFFRRISEKSHGFWGSCVGIYADPCSRPDAAVRLYAHRGSTDAAFREISMPLVSEALYNFLQARKTPANADLVDRWSIAMETQVNVIAGDGEPVAGKKSTWSNGSDTWHSIRIPKNAATDPTWEDYKIGYPFDLYAEGIGMTGWDWKARRSRHFGYDFDALTGHAQGIGIEDEGIGEGQAGRLRLALRRSPPQHGRRRHPPLRLPRRCRRPHREPHRARRPGPLHPGDDVGRGGLRLRQRDRRLRPRHVDMAPQDVGREPRPGDHQAGHEAAGRGRPAGQLAGPHRSGQGPPLQDPRQRDGRRRHGPLRGPGVQPEDHSPGRQPQGPDRSPDALRRNDPLGRRPPSAADPHHGPPRSAGTAPRARP